MKNNNSTRTIATGNNAHSSSASVIEEPNSEELHEIMEELEGLEVYEDETDDEEDTSEDSGESDDYEDSDKYDDYYDTDYMERENGERADSGSKVKTDKNNSKEEYCSDLINIEKQYAADMRSIKLLTEAEEKSLGEKVLAAAVAKESLSENEISEMSAETVYELETVIREGLEARNSLVEGNLRLVYMLANKYSRIYRIAKMDLIQAGNEGLIIAAEKFDVTKGFRFSTYATWWIKQSMTRFRDKSVTVIKLPVHKHEMLRKFNKYINEVFVETGKHPTDEMIAEHFDLSLKEVRKLRSYNVDACSLDATIDEDESTSLMEMIEDSTVVRPEDSITRTDLMNSINKVMDHLTGRQAYILKHHYGLMGEDTMTLEDIGKQFGVCRERIRQVEEQAFRRIKNTPWMRNVLEVYLLDD